MSFYVNKNQETAKFLITGDDLKEIGINPVNKVVLIIRKETSLFSKVEGSEIFTVIEKNDVKNIENIKAHVKSKYPLGNL